MAKTGPGMQDFFCETLELEFRVAPEEFDKDAFLADIESIEHRDSDLHNFGYGSSTKPNEQHAHIEVDLRGKKRFRFRITYHSFPGDTNDTRPPYMEDCAQWLGGFFKVEEIKASLRAAYVFDKRFAPVVPLPFPLVAASKRLAGSEVTGLSLHLPTEMGVKRAIVQRERETDETSVQIDASVKLKLRDFAIQSQLERLAIAVTALVSPVGQEMNGQ
jgi:hypothetical protein